MKFPLKTLLLVWLMFVAIQASAQTTSATPPKKVEEQRVERVYYINHRPFNDFARYVVYKLKQDKVDLNAPFVVEFESVLTYNGKLDPKLSKFTKTEGDKKLIEIVKNGIAAISDSGYLSYLEKIGNKKGFVSIQQDKDNFSVSIKSELVSETEAKKLATGFNSVLQIAKYRKQKFQTDQNDKEDLLLLDFGSVKSEGKFLMLNFVMPQAVKQELINKNLNELKMERYYQ